MKRGHQFDCKHPGATTMYASNFNDVVRVKLCPACKRDINDNLSDPRGVGDTITEAVRLRDVKHAPNR